MKNKKHKKTIGLDTPKKVIGIDVCKDSVSIVRLEKSYGKISLIGCSRVAIDKESPGGNGIERFKAIASAVRKSGITSYPRHCDAGLCFRSSPELLQILNPPDPSPDVTRKFIQEEIRQYAVLPLKNVLIDYCSLRSYDSSAQKSALVGAAQIEPLTMAAKEFDKNHVDIRSIESAIIALIRACYGKVIKHAGQKNVMLVLLHDENMSLCVFSGQKFDFLRIKKFDFDFSDTKKHIDVIAEQIESVVQFYELERTSEQKNWPVYLAGSFDLSKAKEIAGQLRNHIRRQNIEISEIDVSNVDIISEGVKTDDFSPVAAGAAMKLLDVNDFGTSINLLPNEIYEIRKARRQLLAIINIAALIFVLIFIYIAFLTKETAHARNEFIQSKQNRANINIPQLIRTRADVNEAAQRIAWNVKTINTALKDKTWHNWAFILTEIGTKAPQTVRIQNIESRNSSTVKINGLAINYNAINDFINRLNSCKIINSAQLTDAKQNTQYSNGMTDYSIICSIDNKKIKDN
jgi:Tfp pilus assembly PilM family ATPase/Tfp pilus assembly protein PilN